MPRRPKAELEAAHAEKLALFEVLWNWRKQLLIHPIPAEIDPLNVAKLNLEKFTPSQALSGLQEAINDTLESARDATAVEILDLNERLKAAGQPSFLELSATSAKKVQRAFDAGEIKSAEEYYLIIALLGDVENDIPPEKIAVFNAMIREYEASAS